MNINITLLFQIANIVITYFVLKRYLLIPLFIFFERTKKKKQEELKTLASQERLLEDLKERYKKNIIDFQHRMKHYYVQKEVLPSLSITYKQHALDDNEMINITEKIEAIIREKVPHVR